MEKSTNIPLWTICLFWPIIFKESTMNFAGYEKVASSYSDLPFAIYTSLCERWFKKIEVKETSNKLSLVHVVWNQAHGWFLFLQQQPRGVFLHQGGKVKNNIRRNNDLDHSSTMRFLCQSVPFLSPIRTYIGDFADPREGGRRHCDKRKGLRCIFKQIFR